MFDHSHGYPSVTNLYRSLLILTIGQAFFGTKYATPARFIERDAYTWYIKGGETSDGWVVARDERIVGYFFNYESSRHPFRPHRPNVPSDVWRHFRGLPVNLHSLVDSDELQRRISPELEEDRQIVTAVFWRSSNHLSADEPWETVLHHGGTAIRSLFARWDDPSHYMEHPVEMSIYERKIAVGDRPLILSVADGRWWAETVVDSWSRQRGGTPPLGAARAPTPLDRVPERKADEVELEFARFHFAKVGIILP